MDHEERYNICRMFYKFMFIENVLYSYSISQGILVLFRAEQSRMTIVWLKFKEKNITFRIRGYVRKKKKGKKLGGKII